MLGTTADREHGGYLVVRSTLGRRQPWTSALSVSDPGSRIPAGFTTGVAIFTCVIERTVAMEAVW